MNIKTLTRTALFTAIICVATMIISIPVPATKGYVNTGEVAVFLSALLLPGSWGILAAALGSSLADVFLGYTFYAPITFIVKGIEAWIAIKIFNTKKLKTVFVLAIASLFMPLGYFIAESFMYGLPPAVAAVPGNIAQGIFGAIVASLIYPLLKKTRYF